MTYVVPSSSNARRSSCAPSRVGGAPEPTTPSSRISRRTRALRAVLPTSIARPSRPRDPLFAAAACSVSSGSVARRAVRLEFPGETRPNAATRGAGLRTPAPRPGRSARRARLRRLRASGRSRRGMGCSPCGTGRSRNRLRAAARARPPASGGGNSTSPSTCLSSSTRAGGRSAIASRAANRSRMTTCISSV